jgi:hypothetical protein
LALLGGAWLSILIQVSDWRVPANYGFTEEELGFIINYDIKYRMGRDTEADDE